MFAELNCLSSLPSLFLSRSSFFVKALFWVFLSTKCANNSTFVLFILDLMGYNNLIRHSNSENVYILLLAF